MKRNRKFIRGNRSWKTVNSWNETASSCFETGISFSRIRMGLNPRVYWKETFPWARKSGSNSSWDWLSQGCRKDQSMLGGSVFPFFLAISETIFLYSSLFPWNLLRELLIRYGMMILLSSFFQALSNSSSKNSTLSSSLPDFFASMNSSSDNILSVSPW